MTTGADLDRKVSCSIDLKSGATIDEFLAGCPTVSRKVVEGYLELAQDLVTECVGSHDLLWNRSRGFHGEKVVEP